MTLLRMPEVSKAYSNHPIAVAEAWVRNFVPQSVKVVTMAYRNANLNLNDIATPLISVAQANAKHRQRMIKVIESGVHMRQAMQLYNVCDRDGNGVLTWNVGEIRDYVLAVFRHYTLSPPAEEQIYRVYQRFDADRSYSLDANECLELVDCIFRALFAIEPPRLVAALPNSHAVLPAYQPVPRTSGASSSSAGTLPQATAARRVASPKALPATAYQVTPQPGSHVAGSASQRILSPQPVGSGHRIVGPDV